MVTRNKVLKVETPKGPEAMRVFNRRKNSTGFGWGQIDAALLFAALASALENDIAVMFSRAAGGRGVCLRLMRGKAVPPEVEYAFDSEELNGLLELVVEAYGSPSEDAVLTIRSEIEAFTRRNQAHTTAMSLAADD